MKGMTVEQANYCYDLKCGNVEVANLDWCLLNTALEIDDVFFGSGVMLDFAQAIDNEFAATDVVKDILNKIDGDKWL